MRVSQVGLSVFGTIGVVASALAGVAIWLLVADPVTMADAVATGRMPVLMRALAVILVEALHNLARYL